LSLTLFYVTFEKKSMDWCKKGVKVSFIHSDDTGVILNVLDTDLVLIKLDGDHIEIPAFIEDIEPFSLNESKKISTKKPENKKEEVNHFEPQKLSYTILHSQGIQIAFVPMLDKKNDATDKLQPYLINDTPYDYSFSIQLHLKHFKVWQQDGKLDSMSYSGLPVFDIDFLNEAPEISACFNRVSTEGPGPDIEKKMKLKAKTFFNHKQTAPIINQPAHVFILLEKSAGFDQILKTDKDSLKEYTLENAKPISLKKDHLPNLNHSVKSKSEFSIELDLHIESLTSDNHKISNAQILQIQMKKFEAYIDEAVRQGVERVFIIHGIGKGHLRNLITASLIRNPNVITFKNEFHPRYGHGATEVIFL